jgi:hypothetical protein
MKKWTIGCLVVTAVVMLILTALFVANHIPKNVVGTQGYERPSLQLLRAIGQTIIDGSSSLSTFTANNAKIPQQTHSFSTTFAETTMDILDGIINSICAPERFTV